MLLDANENFIHLSWRSSDTHHSKHARQHTHTHTCVCVCVVSNKPNHTHTHVSRATQQPATSLFHNSKCVFCVSTRVCFVTCIMRFAPLLLLAPGSDISSSVRPITSTPPPPSLAIITASNSLHVLDEENTDKYETTTQHTHKKIHTRNSTHKRRKSCWKIAGASVKRSST